VSSRATLCYTSVNCSVQEQRSVKIARMELQLCVASTDNQFGFKKGLSCSHAIYSVRNIVNRFVSRGSTVNLCAIDLSKAFDKVNHYGLYIKLMKRHIPVLFLELVENLFSSCYTRIKWDEHWSEEFRVDFGVRQGSVLSPFLFAIYTDDIGNLCNPGNGLYTILYADDIILLAPSVVSLEKLLHNCELELNWLDMVINSKKSVCCVLVRVMMLGVVKLSVLLEKLSLGVMKLDI